MAKQNDTERTMPSDLQAEQDREYQRQRSAKATANESREAAPRPIREVERVESAETSVQVPDALGNEPRRLNEPVSSKEPVDAGPGGLELPPQGEVAGGNITKLLEAPLDDTRVIAPMAKERAAMMTKVGQQIAGLVARPITEWGVIGPGEVIRGHMILLDLNSGQKVRAEDGHRVGRGELFMNLRNVPEALSTGDTIDRVLKA